MGNNILEENLESIEGYVDHIIYRNADNGYTVLVLVCNEEEETCVGVFSDIAEGENIKAKGSYTEHPTYGRQFQVKSFEEKAPQDEVAIERYRGSGESEKRSSAGNDFFAAIRDQYHTCSENI